MTRLARRLRASLAVILAAALVLLSPGMEAPRIFAAVTVSAAPVEGLRVQTPTAGASAAAFRVNAAASSPVFAPRSSFAAPVRFEPAPAVRGNAAVMAAMPQISQALAPHLETVANARVSDSGAAAAGREIEAVVTGQKNSGSGAADAVAGTEGTGAPALSVLGAASAPVDAPKAGVPAAPTPASGKVVHSELAYRAHRLALSMIASLTGAVYSLPVAGPALTAKLIASAADKNLVLSDFDDTLAAYNQTLPADMIESIRAIRAAGKDFAIISDRGDEKSDRQMTVFESLESLPLDLRAGMYVAANSGARVYRFDEQGVPQRVFQESEVPPLADGVKAKVAAAAEATKAQLASIGTEQYVPVPTEKIPAESWSSYGYAMMLKVGSSKESVVRAAEILQAELAKNGFDVEVNPRFAKNPAQPPYINFSIVTKAGSASRIAKALKADASDTVIVGDSQYAPHRAKKESWLTRLGLKLSGRPIPETGNQTDRNMEKGVPGALTLSVGTMGDPRASTLWVLDGKGPSVTKKILDSVASKPRGAPKAIDWETTIHAAGAVMIIAAAAAGFYAMISAFAEIYRLAVEHLSDSVRNWNEFGPIFGGVLGMGIVGKKAADAKAEPKTEAAKPSEPDPGIAFLKEMAIGFTGLAIVIAVYLAIFYAAMNAPAAVDPNMVPGMPAMPHGGWEMLFGGILGGGAAAAAAKTRKPAWTLKQSVSPASPIDGFESFVFDHAVAAAKELAVNAGYRPENLRLSSAVLEPRAWGEDWVFSFVSPRESPFKDPRAYRLKVRRTMVSETMVDAYDAQDLGPIRGFVAHPVALVPDMIKVKPMAAVAASGDDARTLALEARWGKGDLPQLVWVIRGENGKELKSIDSVTGVETVPQPWQAVKSALVTIGLILATGGLYALLYWAFSHSAPVYDPDAIPGVPHGGWEMLFGGAVAAAAGRGGKGHKPKVTDESVRASASSVASYKGRPWSQTEYNMAYYNTLESLKKAGATKAQLALFEKLCAEAPIRGGSFNPWSGD